MTNRDWRLQAACRGLSPAEADRIFFPPTGGREDAYTEAKSICAICPVREECGNEALVIEAGNSAAARYGMFGGLTPVERWARSRTATNVDRSPVEGFTHGTTTAVRYGHCRCDVCTAAQTERTQRYRATRAAIDRARATGREAEGTCRHCGEVFVKVKGHQDFCCPEHGTAWRNANRPTTRAERGAA